MRYETAVPIGMGGIAEVLRAYDPELKRDVALKLLRRDDPVLAERMLREAQAQARVAHPNVCPVYETGVSDDGRLYIAMQFIDGPTLDVAAAGMSLEQKVGLLRDVASAVQAAHAAGLIHRDLKPGNILVERQDDGSLKPWVVDFGIALQRDAPGLTLTGQVMGTPAYMPPEQARGELDKVDRRSDVYALGAVAYHLLAGRPPFTGQSTVEVLVQILQSDPVPVRRIVPHVPADLETIVMKCLEKEPERRYPAARALADDLTRFLDGEPVSARPASWRYRLAKKARKNKTAAALVSAIALVLPAGAVKYTLDLQSERERARASQREAEDLMDFMLEDLYNRLEPLGRVELLDEVARKSLRHHESMDGDEADAEALYRRARAFRNVGLVLEAEGDLEGALAGFDRFRSIMTELSSRDGEVAAWRIELANSLRLVGEVLQEQGRLDEALATYRESLAVARDAAGRNPGSQDGQAMLWYGHINVGWLLLERGELDEAMDHFETGLEILSRATEAEPQKAEWRYKLSSNLAYVGLVEQDRGELESALESFERALHTALSLAGLEPSNTMWQFEVALNHGRIAYVRLECGDLDGAVRAYESALEITEELAARDGANAKWQRELAVDNSGLATALRRLGDLEGARERMEASLAISRRLSRRDPTNVSMANDLAWDLNQLGLVRQALGDESAARAAWEEAVAVVTPVVAAAGVPYYLDTLVQVLLHLGRVDEARPIVERLRAAGWDDPDFLELCRRNDL